MVILFPKNGRQFLQVIMLLLGGAGRKFYLILPGKVTRARLGGDLTGLMHPSNHLVVITVSQGDDPLFSQVCLGDSGVLLSFCASTFFISQ